MQLINDGQMRIQTIKSGSFSGLRLKVAVRRRNIDSVRLHLKAVSFLQGGVSLRHGLRITENDFGLLARSRKRVDLSSGLMVGAQTKQPYA